MEEQATREISDHIRTIRRLVDDADHFLNKIPADPYSVQLSLDEFRKSSRKKLRTLEKSLAAHRRENEDLLNLNPILEESLALVRADGDSWNEAQLVPVFDLFEQIVQQLEMTQINVQEAEMELANLAGADSTYRKTLDILEPYSARSEPVPCPVCDKPITPPERNAIVANIGAELDHIAAEQELLEKKTKEGKKFIETILPNLHSLRRLRNAIMHSRFQSISGRETIVELESLVAKQLAEYEESCQKLESAVRSIEQEMADVERENAAYIAIQQQLAYQGGFDSLDEAREGLVDLETRWLSLRAAEQASQKVLTERRNVDMDEIYDQVATVWEAFTGKSDWQVEIDHDGMPVLEDGEERELDLSQFSGGEKTALLVVLHTIICQHFSDTDFLLIDEPLEHLDSINRRSLIQFLIRAYRRGRFGQAIVATFEESLLRKYMSDEDVNVIHLID